MSYIPDAPAVFQWARDLLDYAHGIENLRIVINVFAIVVAALMAVVIYVSTASTSEVR